MREAVFNFTADFLLTCLLNPDSYFHSFEIVFLHHWEIPICIQFTIFCFYLHVIILLFYDLSFFKIAFSWNTRCIALFAVPAFVIRHLLKELAGKPTSSLAKSLKMGTSTLYGDQLIPYMK